MVEAYEQKLHLKASEGYVGGKGDEFPLGLRIPILGGGNFAGKWDPKYIKRERANQGLPDGDVTGRAEDNPSIDLAQMFYRAFGKAIHDAYYVERKFPSGLRVEICLYSPGDYAAFGFVGSSREQLGGVWMPEVGV